MQARNRILDWAEGEFRVRDDGECLLTGMRGEKLERLGLPQRR